MASHPYDNRPDWAYWRRAVAQAEDLDPMIEAPFRFDERDLVVTAGSCFAQHIGRYLKADGYHFFVSEPAHPLVSAGAEIRLNYGVFSARYGNIYTPRQLVQLFDRAYGEFLPREDIWRESSGVVVDPFRPQIQPGGFNCEDELRYDRLRHFRAVREAFEKLDVFIFTLGLTEAWRSRADGAVFPLCPGVTGGLFDASRHEFVNFGVEAIVGDMRAFLDRLRGVNRKAKVIFTVSPVPLVATAEARHVLVSTVYSKSVLRVACESLAREKNVAYFPSYEIVAGGYAKDYFAADRRSVTEEGVAHVMRVFSRHFLKYSFTKKTIRRARDLVARGNPAGNDELAAVEAAVKVMCDEEALDIQVRESRGDRVAGSSTRKFMTSTPLGKVKKKPSATASPAAPRAPFALEPVKDVAAMEGGFDALSNEPWLKAPGHDALRSGEFVEIRYSASIFDEVRRPVLRFFDCSGRFADVVAPAPYAGAAIWIGRVPADFRDLWISPTNVPGRFEFRIDSIRRLGFRALLPHAAAAPRRAFFALGAGFARLHEEAELNWRWTLGRANTQNFRDFVAGRRSSIAPDPRADWASAPEFVIFLDESDASADQAKATALSLRTQTYPKWRLSAPHTSVEAAPAVLFMRLQAGDELEPNALACVVEFFSRHPDKSVVYGDEISVNGDGRESLDLKPDWSPLLHRHAPYLGRASAWKGSLGAEFPSASLQDPATGVGHLRRALMRGRARAPAEPLEPAEQHGCSNDASVSIIIPTRDRAELLGPCVASLLRSELGDRDEILILDNGSVEKNTEALFQRLALDSPNIKVLRRPGPFSFAALCNGAARDAKGEALLFLNNDTEVRSKDWRTRLLDLAMQPDIGAVGARLLFPKGHVQHQGVVLGLGGVAGHFGAGALPEAPGWRRHGRAPHETSAVTGACLMVERRKFDAVGGFDEINLPIEFNDLDLCLRLAERGWRAVCDPRVELVHHESASRGSGAFRLQRVYRKERAFFVEKWRRAIRDDPYFSPALSLYSLDEVLW